MTIQALNPGDRVSGLYYDAPFTGTVTEKEPGKEPGHTTYTIRLTEPLLLYDIERSAIAITVDETGKRRADGEVTGYVRAA